MSQWKWCLEENGKVIKGWYEYNQKWYHLNEETGILDTGWFKDKDSRWYYLDKQNGDMKTGWIELKGKWFYLEPNSNGYMGFMYCNGTYTIDGKSYTFDKDGVWIEDKTNHTISDDLVKFIEGFEGCYLTAYYCPSNVLTIGIGNTNTKWTSLGNITREQAYEALKEDMKVFSNGVDNLVNNANIILNKCQREALISFSFNVGLSALRSSTLWKNICKGVVDSVTITENFCRWNKGNNAVVLEGLNRRRKCEARLFLTGNYSTDI